MRNGLAALALGIALALPLATLAGPAVTLQPPGGPDVKAYLSDPASDPPLSADQLQALVQQKIRYVFVIFNENRSFDSEYGTFPGANGLYSDGQVARPAPGAAQTYTDLEGNRVTVAPFRIGPAENANVVDSVDHSHTGLARKIDVVDGTARMDGFARDEYTRLAPPGATAAQQAKARQYARLVMAHVDCDTIPFFWRWASNFTVFDNIFATEDTPSTPNAIALLAGQAGETQWVKHPGPAADPTATGSSGPIGGTFQQRSQSVTFSGTATTQGPPLVNDPQPYYGSQFDATVSQGGVHRQPYGPAESYAKDNIAANLTFASLPLTLMGNTVTRVMQQDLHPEVDTADIRQDVAAIQRLDHPPVAWRWYENGYGIESTDQGGVASHTAYVSHHEGPQYLGYLADNPAVYDNLQGETQFFADIAGKSLPQGGVFYIRGGYLNQMGLVPYTHPGTPPDEVRAIVAAKSGDDNHPGYSDHQLSEAMAARVINAIAGDAKLWAQSAIVITYDESDGFYDHVPPRILAYGPDGLPLARGVRVPLILISPYARTHAVSHVEGDHNAVIETINAVFGLPALASLPDESQALVAGDAPYFNQFGPPGFHQKALGPRDIPSEVSGSLLSGFDPRRLMGLAPPLPAAYAQTEPAMLTSLPHYAGHGCQALGLRPVAPESDNNVPPGFNPLPSTYPAANAAAADAPDHR
jgi:phospholipase C